MVVGFVAKSAPEFLSVDLLPNPTARLMGSVFTGVRTPSRVWAEGFWLKVPGKARAQSFMCCFLQHKEYDNDYA
jgi:hypothetical protein